MRDRLIDLLDKKIYFVDLADSDMVWTTEKLAELADYLLAEGVIVSPVKVGGNMYTLSRGRVKKWKVHFVGINSMGEIKFHIADEGFNNMLEMWNYNIGQLVFLTEAEAKEALAERKENGT